MSVKVNNVVKKYGEQKALDDVSFEVVKGKVTGFLGPNGAGKSTMMKIITCFIPPTQGTVEVLGFGIENDALEIKRRVGYLPEHNPLYVDMYVKEFLLFIGGVYGLKGSVAENRIKETIAMVGLEAEQRKKIQALSKGYRQRVGLAKALLHNPEVLILDEPSSGLDPNQLAGIRQLIKELGKTKTVLLSTHIMQEVEAICDDVMIINKGKIVANSSVEMLTKKQGPQNRIILKLSGEVKTEWLKAISGVRKVTVGDEECCWIIDGEADIDLRKNITRWVVEKDFAIVEMKQASDSLEDVFRKLTA